MKSKKVFYITTSIIVALLIVSFILGTIYDLQISRLFADLQEGQYYSSNIYAILGETFGENILYVLLICAFAIMFFHLIRNPLQKKWLNVLLIIFFAVAGWIVSFYCINKTLKYISIYSNFGLDQFLQNILGKIAIMLFACIVAILVYLCFIKMKKETLQQLSGWALSVMIIALISNLIVQGAKLVFARTRYRAMMYEGDSSFSHFTNWFQINHDNFATATGADFIRDYYKSFPSGHTCAAASSFLLILLPNFYHKTNTFAWKFTFTAFAIVYTFLVALSRIVAGAHFFTDVFVGGIVTIITVFVAKWFVIEKRFKKNISINS